MQLLRLPALLFDHLNIGKAGHFKHFHNRLTNAGEFQGTDLLHFLLRTEKHTKSCTGDILQSLQIQQETLMLSMFSLIERTLGSALPYHPI